MINEAWLAPGSWSLRLKQETPDTVRNAVDWTKTSAAAFGHVMVFPSRVDAASLSSADRLKASIWTGVLLEWSDAYTIGGAGPGWWLGDSSGKGPLIETAITNTSAGLSTWLTSLTPSSLTAGTATGGTTVTATFQWVTYRQAIEALLAANSASGNIGWWVTPEMKLYFGGASAVTPATTALALRRSTGHEAYYSALDVVNLNRSMDMREYVSKVRVNGPSAVGTYSAASGYLDINGNTVSIIEFIDVPTAAPGTENTVAQAEYVARNSIRRQVTITSDAYSIATIGMNLNRDVQTGGLIYVFDPELGLVDTANQIQFQGQTVFPLQMQVMAQSWPVRTGMGVWFRDGNGTLTDLTDWFEPETQDASIEVGSLPRTLGNPSGIQGLMDIGEVGPAVDNGAWITWTPALTASTSDPTLGSGSTATGRYRRIGSTIIGDAQITFGTSGTAAGTGTYQVSLPWPAAVTGSNANVAGQGWMLDASTNQLVTFVLRTFPTGSKAEIYFSATTNFFATAAVPWAWSTSDTIRFSFTYEATVS